LPLLTPLSRQGRKRIKKPENREKKYGEYNVGEEIYWRGYIIHGVFNGPMFVLISLGIIK
jgi:hypothetical protein